MFKVFLKSILCHIMDYVFCFFSTYMCGTNTIRSHQDVIFVSILYEKICVFYFIVYWIHREKRTSLWLSWDWRKFSHAIAVLYAVLQEGAVCSKRLIIHLVVACGL